MMEPAMMPASKYFWKKGYMTIKGRLEMMMEDETLNERQLSELMKTHQTLENLTRLNKSLLLLCKIDNRQFNDVKPVCLNELLLAYLDDYKEAYAYRDIHVEVDVEECFRKEMSESLAVVLVKPERYEDAASIADHLNAKKTVVLNLEQTSKDVSRRLIDLLMAG